MAYADLGQSNTPPKLPSQEMPGWLDLLNALTGKKQPTWGDVVKYSNDPKSGGGWQLPIMEQEPQSLYSAFSNVTGYNQGSAYQNWLNNQYGRYRGQYETMAAANPALNFYDFLTRVNPDADYKLTASPYDRGEYRSGYSLAPTMRMSW